MQCPLPCLSATRLSPRPVSVVVEVVVLTAQVQQKKSAESIIYNRYTVKALMSVAPNGSREVPG